MVARGRKTAKSAKAANRTKPAHEPLSTTIQSVKSKPRKPKFGRRRAQKPKSETARLKNLLQAAEDRQTATAEILKVIAGSPSDTTPVFEAIASSAKRLLGGFSTAVFRVLDGTVHLAAFTPVSPAADAALQADFPQPVENFVAFRLAQHGEPIAIADTEEVSHAPAREIARLHGFRSMLWVPMVNGDLTIGIISVTRAKPGEFAINHIQLLQTFADQAVIAIENARLFNETRDALERQTATADVLKVISRSAFDLQSVLDTLTESALRLCDADMGAIAQQKGDSYHYVSTFSFPPEIHDFSKNISHEPGYGTVVGRTLLAGSVIQVPDVLADARYAGKGLELQKKAGFGTVLGVPLLREGAPIGVIVLTRRAIRPFTQKQIELVSTFADQAVIAIENVRLFDEVQAKTRDLSESLQQQTATSDVLNVISNSLTDTQPVFDAIVQSGSKLFPGALVSVALRYGNTINAAAVVAPDPARVEAWRRTISRTPLARNYMHGAALLDRRIVDIPDVADAPAEFAAGGQNFLTSGNRAITIMPMIRGDEAIGLLSVVRLVPGPLSDKQIAVLKTFASQAVIAIENTRLLKELRKRTDDLTLSLNDLRTAQDRLVQTEKLASLGQLTAGIAHEIKNPLNFVNNFSALSAELTDELNDVLKPVAMDGKVRGEVDELTGMLKDNLQKVVQHGKRADSIVKNMLLHSREGSGEHRPADINSLLDESLNLAYHGARAEKPGFSITLQRDFDPNAGTIELFPQEITRAFLNLIANGFYAANRRKKDNGEPGFDPILRATTKNLGSTVEIRIRDNGTGIPVAVREKMFNPFFTTKPAGEGTGLGLSMSHDIIVKQHGGRIDVETEPGQFTEFIIVLPRTSNLSGKSRG
jgi:signal transduction histidine kinase